MILVNSTGVVQMTKKILIIDGEDEEILTVEDFVIRQILPPQYRESNMMDINTQFKRRLVQRLADAGTLDIKDILHMRSGS